MLNLTLNDHTQKVIISHLTETERLLTECATKASGCEQSASIILLPDLGLPNNVTRMLGGFFTGAIYSWSTTVPIVPVDATINSCGVSVFRLRKPFASTDAFIESVNRAAVANDDISKYIWNYREGNHFVMYGYSDGYSDLKSGCYLVLHSGAAEFKNQYEGLYPTPGNWYYDKIQCIQSRQSRYLRYINGVTAEKFIQRAATLGDLNCSRHRFHAELIAPGNIDDEVVHMPHYGMMSESCVSIGVSWMRGGDIFPLLSRPRASIFILKARDGGLNKYDTSEQALCLQPHGLGQICREPFKIEYEGTRMKIGGYSVMPGDSIAGLPYFDLRQLDAAAGDIPGIVQKVMHICPSSVVGTVQHLASVCGREKHVIPNLRAC